MCDHEENEPKNESNKKGVDKMGITKPIKPIKPMEHEFKTKQEEENFAKWVNGQNPTPKEITDQLKSDLRLYRKMKQSNEDNN